jgi:hypothetical protein
VLSRFVSSAVAASAVAALLTVAASTAGVIFDAEASGGVSSITSITVKSSAFLAQQTSSMPKAPSSSVKASSDATPVDLA